MQMKIPESLEEWNAAGEGYFMEHLGLVIEKVEPKEVIVSFDVARHHKAWNGFLHAGSVVSLADTACGYGTIRNLPEGANGFTTVELKSNHLATAREGTVRCRAQPLHLGRSTHVWDAEVRAMSTDKVMAHFRCTQMILWPKP